MIQIITNIFNASLSIGYFPKKWKCAILTMILKPDKDSSSPKSYRPISLLPILGKVMERIMTERITLYMIDKGLLNKFQYGFQKKKSCVHQVLRLSEHINRWFNAKPSGRTIAVLIDAEKAFDCLWHDGLRQMILKDNFPTILIRWISSCFHTEPAESELIIIFQILLSSRLESPRVVC